LNLSRDSTARWTHVATVEIGQDVPNFIDLVSDPSLHFRAESSDRSPGGFQWFEIFVDDARGEAHCARTVWTVLTALQKAAAAGALPDFRIITGEHWLTVGAVFANAPEVDAMSHAGA
jgi:hypothetical protein